MQEQSIDDDEDGEWQKKVYKPKTPEIDEEALAVFDMKTQKIVSLIENKNDNIELSKESKPVSQVIKATYGVSYREDIL